MMRHIAAAILVLAALAALVLACSPSWRYAARRAYQRLADALFALACDLLLPISTFCKVCNMLRGMAIGIALGAALAVAVLWICFPVRGGC